MVLCAGTYLTVLKNYKAAPVRQKKLGEEIFKALNPSLVPGYDSVDISPCFRGMRNVNHMVALNIEEIMSEEVALRVKEYVLPLLNASKRRDIVCALKKIIADDVEIEEDVEINLVNHQKKGELLEKTEFVFHEFLAGILLYVVRYTDNFKKAEDVKQLTAEYLKEATKNKYEITFVDEGQLNCAGELDNIIDDVRLLNEAFPTYAGIQAVREMNLNRLSDDVKQIIDKISHLDMDTETPFRMKPLNVRKKIRDKLLQDNIITQVNGYYEQINDVIEMAKSEGKLNERRLAKVISRMYKDSEDRLPQEDVIEAMVLLIHTQTGHINREACRILVSYFIQRCEVFDEITE